MKKTSEKRSTRRRVSRKSKRASRKSGARRIPRNSPLRRKYRLCPNLSKVVGVRKSTRGQLVKRMWKMIHRRKLKDPRNGRYMVCDRRMRRVFGKKRVRAFGMMKYLNQHLH